jgi:acyl-CoA thioesterase-1
LKAFLHFCRTTSLPEIKRFSLALFLVAVTPSAMAAQIVALGATSTAGAGHGPHSSGVPREQAFPAQLEAMLRAQNCAVSVENAGVAGDTTSDMLGRLPGLIGSDTKVLILQPGTNDTLNFLHDRQQNIAAMPRSTA